MFHDLQDTATERIYEAFVSSWQVYTFEILLRKNLKNALNLNTGFDKEELLKICNGIVTTKITRSECINEAAQALSKYLDLPVDITKRAIRCRIEVLIKNQFADFAKNERVIVSRFVEKMKLASVYLKEAFYDC